MNALTKTNGDIRKNRGLKSMSGFTLIELLVVVAIIAILATFAAGGGIRGWLTQRGLSTAVEQMRGDLQRAKLLAIRQRANCTITTNTPGSNQYTISLNNQVLDLRNYRGNVAFTDPVTPVVITFTPWGTCTAGVIQLTNQDATAIYRLRTSGSGGISKQVWSGANWVSTRI